MQSNAKLVSFTLIVTTVGMLQSFTEHIIAISKYLRCLGLATVPRIRFIKRGAGVNGNDSGSKKSRVSTPREKICNAFS